MHLTLLGTGCPICDPKRMGPSNLVRRNDKAFLVDCGSGATQRLVGAGSKGAALDAVFLTHLHSDHIVDLLQLILSSWHQGRDRPQFFYGPSGTKRFVDGLLELWRPEFEQRIAHEKRASIAALSVEVTEFTEGQIWQQGDITVRAVKVEHSPIKNAVGFIFEAGGKKLAFSGDTAYCPALIEASKGADVLVHECYLHHEIKPAPGRTAESMRNVAAYHTLADEVGKVAAEAKVKCLVLNHFVPTTFDRHEVLKRVRADYDGPIVVGEDLMGLDLGSGALTYQDAVIGLDALVR
ncbi:MAG: MBL fold metallo-hydrolase [Rhodospirillales bacterium]